MRAYTHLIIIISHMGICIYINALTISGRYVTTVLCWPYTVAGLVMLVWAALPMAVCV